MTNCLLIPFLLVSCQKVIDVKLENGATLYVIEGIITDQAAPWQVSISQTKDFSDDNNFPGLSGAMVTIEHNGMVTALSEKSSGIYQSPALQGIPGDTYHLTAIIQGQSFTAASTMPMPVELDSIYITTGRFSKDKLVTTVYKDPAGILNYYRSVQYVNGKKEKTIFVDNDEFTDGQLVKSPLNFDNGTDDSTRKIKSGDLVRIDLLSIDPMVYKYWYSLEEGGTGNGWNGSPSNPASNISGGAMGYFSAHTQRSRSIVVP